MAARKKASKKVNGSSNGNVPLARLKGQDRIKAIVAKYPQIEKPIGQLAQIFEVVTPNDARPVSGLIQARVAAFCKERLDEKAEYQKQQKLDRLAAKEESYREKLAELTKLREELGISA